jgi:hypothetical protein
MFVGDKSDHEPDKINLSTGKERKKNTSKGVRQKRGV